jgi:hypothetical protein
MPIVLGLASSHAPSMFAPVESWPTIHKALTGSVPQPPALALETPEVLSGYADRINAGFKSLTDRLEEAKVDLVLLVGDDQTEVFSDACIPAIAVFTGEETSGTTSLRWLGQTPEQNHVTLRNNPAVAKWMVRKLVERGFDIAYCDHLTPLGRPQSGIGHAYSRPAKALGIVDRNIPTTPIFLNGYHPPQPTGARCYQLGVELFEMFCKRPERVAIYASGGLSHCPMGPRAGWIDEPLDRWVLERLAAGEGDRLQSLYSIDSETLRSGTGEIRAWITVAGAFHQKPATVVDYIPVHHSVTGLGFAYWNA